jgi:Uma2 family endonuclease
MESQLRQVHAIDPKFRPAQPLLCIEILSKDDSMKSMMSRIDDYLQFGVGTCWIIEPADRLTWIADVQGVHPVKDGVLRAGHINLPLTDIWPAA